MIDSRRSQLLRGVLDLCLLAVIEGEPAYGYEMTRRLGDRGLTLVSEGSIYPVLGRLERLGLISSFLQEGGGGPVRRYYRITPQGRESLLAWTDEWRRAKQAVESVLSFERSR